MGFAVGETVGQFKILEYVGQGGMATIYKAHQLTLDRDVALKVIHPTLKEDQAFLTRLSREATIIAKLSHPNIVAVYDFSQFEGVPFLVLQYIDGKTLKAVLQDQKLGTHQVLKIIRPVADALTYAHSRGVLHRDVKPSNILIDTEGHVFLTDFGLARITYSSESTSSHDMMIGSPNYLSPEQAKSESVDVRSDVYSLGIVAYEMFVGRPPFSRDTPYATILAQINDPPPAPRAVNPKVPLAVEQVLLKALAKDPKQRYNTVRDMMRAFENAVRGPKDDPDEQAAPIPLVDYRPVRSLPLTQPISNVRNQLKTAASSIGKSNRRRPLVIAGAAVIAAAVLLLCLTGAFLIALRTPFLRTLGSAPRASASASTRVAAGVGSTTVISPTASLAPRDTPTAASTGGPAATGTPTATLRQPAAAAGAAKGKIAYSIATGDQAEQHTVWVANADGSNPLKVADTALWPAISPDGKRMAYYRMKDEGIYVANLDGSNAQRILVGETCCVQWSRDSKHLIYVQGKLKIGDTHIKMVNPDGSDPTDVNVGAGPYNPAWAPDGNRIVYASTKPNTNTSGLFVYDLTTQVSAMISQDGGGNPQWSPRGDKIAYQAGGNPTNIFVVNPDGTGVKQLTFGKSNDVQPTWSSDGNYVFWRSDQDGKGWAIYVMRADGSDKRLLIKDTPPDQSEKWGGRESLSAGP